MTSTPRSVWISVGVLLTLLVLLGIITVARQRSERAAASTNTAPAAAVQSATIEPTTLSPEASSRATTSNWPPTALSPTNLDAQIDALVVAPASALDGYNRDLFSTWDDADHNGCDTRCEVLARQRSADGTWLSPYDDVVTSDPGALDVDHLVPLGEAWQSGATTWDAATREAFANDLTDPQLVAVSAHANRSKGDRDPASWRPTDQGYWCLYATSWVTVKTVWHLTADEAEVGELHRMAAIC